MHHYFDLIAGTSTGSIIAAALARGMAVAEIIKKYNDLGQRVFQKSWLRQGYVRAFYDEAGLIKELKDVYGADTTMGDPSLQTGLLVITKRLDSGERVADLEQSARPLFRRSAESERRAQFRNIRCGKWCALPPRRRAISILKES